MFRIWWQKFFSFPRTRLARRRGYRPPLSLVRRTNRLSITALEDRITPANNITIATGGLTTIPAGATTFADTGTYTIDPSAIDNATATVNLRANINITFSNAISIAAANVGLDAEALENILVNSGIATQAGGITLKANQGATATSGNFTAIEVSGATITSATGPILLQGTGGNTGSTNTGVYVHNGAVISSTGTGAGAATITLDGNGDAGGNANLGILLSDVGTEVTSIDGAIQLDGTGGAGTSIENEGVVLQASALVSSTGTATITVNGTGGGIGSSTGDNDGVFIFNSPTGGITSVNGAIQITGTPGVGTGGLAIDIGSAGGTVSSTGAANITLSGDSINIDTANGAINAGPNTVTLQPETAGTGIDIGLGTTAGELDLTAAELNRVTAGTMVIGNGSSGNLTVTAPVAPSGTSDLQLVSGGGVTESGTGKLTVGTLLVTASTGIGTSGTPLQTQVSSLGADTATGGVFITNNAASPGALNIAGADGVQAHTSGDIQIINAGSVNIDVSADENVVAASGNILIRATGAGANILTGNDAPAQTVEADNGNITLNAAQDVLLGDTNTQTNGDLKANGNISVTAGRNIILDEQTLVDAIGAGNVTANAGGNISLVQTDIQGAEISTQSGDISLTTGAGGTFTLDSGAAIGYQGAVTSNGGNITISADNMVIKDPVNASTGTVTLDQAGTTSRGVSIGAGTTANTLGLSDTELGEVTAGVLRIGRSDNAGNIAIDGAVTAHAGFGTLDLISGGSIRDNASTDTITVTNLALSASTGIGTSGTPLATDVSTLGADTATGGVFITNNAASPGTLNVAGTDGVQDTGASGDVQLINSGSIDVLTDGDTVRGPGNVTVSALGATSDVQTGGQATSLLTSIRGLASGVVTVEAGRDILFGDPSVSGPGSVRSVSGSIVLTAGRNITVTADAFVNVIGGSGSITATATGDITMLTSSGTEPGAPEFFTAGGNISLTTGAGHTFTAASTGTDAVSSSGGTITIAADDMALNAGIDAGAGIVTLEQAGATSRGVSIGAGTSANTLGLSDSELGEVTAGVLRIGRSDNAGNIVIDGAVTAHAGFSTLSLISGGSVTDASAADTITVTNLAVRAAGGISLDAAVTDLAVRNTTSGNVRVANTGATTLTAVDTLNGSAGNTQGNFGGATTFSAASPFTYAITYTSAGTITTTTTDDGPIDTDNITVNSGVTVTSTGGDVVFDAGDDVVIDGTVQSQARDVDLVAGFGDTDSEGVIAINGTVSATATVTLNVNSTNTALAAGTPIATETAASTISAAGLLLLNFPAGAPGPFNLNASPTNSVGTIAASTNAAINFANSGALTIGSVTSTPEGLTSDGILTNNHAVSIQASGTITVAQELNAGTAAATLNSTGGNILQAATLTTTGVAGGAIALTATGTGGIDLAVDTTTPATAGVTATTTNAPIILTSTSQLQVNSINAGTGDVTLTVNNANTATSSITSLHPNDNVADVTGRTVTLDATGPTTGNTGQIGFFLAGGQFFEVAATTLNASTNNSRAWISAIGGTAIGSVNVGTNTAFLRTLNGDLTSTHTGTTPDITAGTVNLSQAPGATSGSFGTAANPLLTQTSTLSANAAVAPAAAGASINVTNVPAGGNLAVVSATTAGGPINLSVDGGNLTTTATTGTDINAPGSTVTLNASGAVISGSSAGVTDVAAANLAITAGAGIGSVANPLKTVVTNLAFNNTGGVIDVANTGALTINAVGSLLTSSNTGTTTTLSAASPMTFAVDTTSAGTLTATTTDDGPIDTDNITVNLGVTVESTGGDVVFHAGDDVDIDGTVESTFRDVDLVAGFGDTDGEGVINITGTVSAVATVTLNVNASNAALPANTPIVSESAGASITAAGLLLLNANPGAPGPFSLDASTTNAVGTIAATTNAVINFRDSTGLTVGAVMSTPEGLTSFGILTNNHDVTLCTITGDISLTQALNVGTATARLQSAGAVTQTAAGVITAADLGVNATGNIGLDQAANAVSGTVALNSTGGSVAFKDTDGFTIGTVAASGCFTGASGISGSGDITICSGASISLAAPLMTTGTVRLQAGGSVTQTAAGTITAANLGVRADGNIGLCVSGSANAVTGTFAADASGGPAGSNIMFLDGSGFTVGTITASGCFTANAVGVTTNNGDADLVSTAGPISLTQAVNAGTGTVRINSGGAVTQTAGGAGAITAANLAVQANGNVDLCEVANTISGMFAAQNAAAGAFIRFLDTAGITVGTVAADTCATGATGADTNNGDIDLVSTAGPISFPASINAGTGTVRLNSGAGVSQGGGTVTAGNLAVLANGTVALCVTGTPNAVSGTFAATDTAAGAGVMFLDASGFTVGTVVGDVCTAGATGVTTNNGDIDLVSTAGPIVLSQAVNAGTGTVRINSGGAVTQTAGATITAANLAVDAAGVIGLCVSGSANAVTGTIAASGTSLMFLDADGFTVGTVAGDACANGATGVTSTAGDTDLVSTAGPITLAQAINSGTGTVRINSGGAVTQTVGGAGAITAANLAVQANGNVDLCEVANTVSGMFAAQDAAAGAFIRFLDTAGITVGTVAADTCAIGATGAGTNNGDIDLVSTSGPITFPASINAGTGTVRLNSGAGVSQGGGTITAGNLAVLANGTIALCVTGTPNAVSGTFAATDTAAGAGVMFLDASGFTVGTVAGDVCTAGATGVTTNNGDIDLVSTAGPITLAQAVNAGTGTVRINSGAAVTQTAGGAGAITAANLTVQAIGVVNLCEVANTVGIFAAADTGSGAGVMFLDSVGYLVGTVTGDACANGATGVVTDNGDIDLVNTTGAANLTAVVNAGKATVRLNSGGTVTQTTAGIISAASLAVVANGAVDLAEANNLVGGTFAALDTAAGAAVRFRDTAGTGLTIGAIAGDACAAGANGIVTNNGDVTVRNQFLNSTAETLTIDGPITAVVSGGTTSTATVRLQAFGDIVQDPNTAGSAPVGPVVPPAAGAPTAGAISAAILGVQSAGGNIFLDRDNVISTGTAAGTLAAAAPAGTVNVRNTAGLVLDAVTTDPVVAGLFDATSGVTGKTVLLATAGGLSQTTAGAIVATTLGVRNTTSGDINLLTATNYTTNTGNQVGTFAGSNTAANGKLDFATLGALTLGTVAGNGTFAQVRGITTNNGESNLRTGTDFTAVDTNYASPLISLGSGNFLLNPGQTGNSIVTFNAEAKTTGTFRLGQRNSVAPEPQAPGITDVTNPAGTPGADNVHSDTFNIRPSNNVLILINGNQPPPGPGRDTLNLNLISVPLTTAITFTPGGTGAGRFDFAGAGAPKTVAFTGIESIGGRGIEAAATQTGLQTYQITAAATIFGRVLTGGINSGQAPANPFIVSPNPVNPVAPFGAPRLAVGDFNGDDVPDLIIGNGPANAPLVTVINGNVLFGAAHALRASDLLSQFFAYSQTFQGGLFVAAGDLDGDGRTEIVTGADAGGGPHVRIFAFNPAPGLTVFNNVVDDAAAHPGVSAFPAGGFYAYGASFTGGVRVAVADVNGDGRADIITGAGAGGGPEVRVFSGATGQPISSFYAYGPTFTGGVYVAGGDYNGDGKADIITGSGAGGPHVRVFSGAGLSAGGAAEVAAIANPLASFYAFGPDGSSSLFGPDFGATTGVGSVAFADIMGVNGVTQPLILVGSNRGANTKVAVFEGNFASPPFAPPAINFNTFPNPFPAVFVVDESAGNVGDLIAPGLRDGTNVGGESF